MMRRFFCWLAGVFAKWGHAESLIEPMNGAPVRYSVARWVGKRHFLLYDGPNGATAKRRYESVVNARDAGRMEFWMDTGNVRAVRSSWERSK